MDKKQFAVLLTSAALSVAVPFPSMAASGISSVSLKISSDIEAGEDGSDVEVTTSSSKYSVDEVEVTNEPDDEWDEGDRPKLEVLLSAEEDYYFDSGLSKSDVDISGSDGSVTSVKRERYELTIRITLDRLDEDDDDEDDYDLEVYDVEWDESDGTAYWDDGGDARKYELRLYRDGSSVTSTTTSNSTYNFSRYFTENGDYYFKVRAVYNSSNKGDWVESDEWYVSSSEARQIRENSPSWSDSSSSGGPGSSGGATSGAWLKDEIGWWYCNPDKSYPVNNWQLIDQNWYYFNAQGYMVTGWVYWNQLWYYCGDSGAMLTDTTTPDGYYVDGQGVWR